jgi:hypothetical protein
MTNLFCLMASRARRRSSKFTTKALIEIHDLEGFQVSLDRDDERPRMTAIDICVCKGFRDNAQRRHCIFRRFERRQIDRLLNRPLT